MRLRVLLSGRKRKRRPLPFGVITFIVAVLVAVSWIAVARAASKQVVIAAWDRQVQITTAARTVKDALTQANIELGPGDSCVPGLDAQLKDGVKVTVSRAVPVFVVYGGQVSTVQTSRTNVGVILAEADVTPGPEDIVVPAPDQDVPESGMIRVVKVTYAEVTEEEDVGYGTETREDESLEAGLTAVYREGVPGVALVTYAVRYEDGDEGSRTERSRQDVEAPTSEVVLMGTLRQVSRGGSDIRFQRAVQVMSTAYCPCVKCCGPAAAGITHMGVPAKKGVIAVDPRVIPLGTRVYVDGYGFALAADTGSAIKGDRIDVCFDTHQEALNWGIRRLKVYILE